MLPAGTGIPPKRIPFSLWNIFRNILHSVFGDVYIVKSAAELRNITLDDISCTRIPQISTSTTTTKVSAETYTLAKPHFSCSARILQHSSSALTSSAVMKHLRSQSSASSTTINSDLMISQGFLCTKPSPFGVTSWTSTTSAFTEAR